MLDSNLSIPALEVAGEKLIDYNSAEGKEIIDKRKNSLEYPI